MVNPRFLPPPLLFTSKYQQRMRRLSCKIFNDFYVPELPKQDLDYSYYHQPVQAWIKKWFSDMRAMQRNEDLPLDLNPQLNPKYYVAHPQFRMLTNELREYGLYRDEHRDFNELMKEVAISRGRVFRERRGPISKADKSKKKK